MADDRAKVYEARFGSGNTTYFIDAKQAVNGRYYVSLTESRRAEADTFSQRRVMIFEEELDVFRKVIAETLDTIAGLVSSRNDAEIRKVREIHPRAFMKWSPAEEEELEREFRKNPDVDSLVKLTGRTGKAVLARLEKLGLVQPAEPAGRDQPVPE